MKVVRHPTGPRLYIFGRRAHHGLTGVLLIAVGTALVAHDASDWRVWFRLDKG